jgi:hypothetical protein
MAFADLAIGAGGTMTREAALLGVPTFSVFGGECAAVDDWLEREGKLRRLRRPDEVLPIRRRDSYDIDLGGLRARGEAILEVFISATTYWSRHAPTPEVTPDAAARVGAVAPTSAYRHSKRQRFHTPG